MENQSKKKKSRVNLFDVIILVIILLAGAVVFYVLRGRNVTVDTVTLQYTVELTGLPAGSDSLVSIGDAMKDNVRNYAAGTVVDVTVQPHQGDAWDTENGVVHRADVEGYETLLITLETEVVETDSSLETAEGLLVRTGTSVSMSNGKLTGAGFIVSIDR